MPESVFETRLAKLLIEEFGKDCWDDSATETAIRWVRAIREFKPNSKIDFKQTTFEATVNQLIAVVDIEFSSLCAHHLFPFMGRIHVGYLPNKLMIGLSKIPRIAHHYATRPNTQETLTRNIASHLKVLLEAQGVAVVIDSIHTCMACRGVKERNARMRTSEMRGVFLTSGTARSEFLDMIPHMESP